MDEMNIIREFLAEPSSASARRAYTTAEQRLSQEYIPGPKSRSKPKWRLRVGGMGLAATAVTAAIVVASGGTTAPTAIPKNSPAVPVQSGQPILLAAATTAEKAPNGSGTYWYVKLVSRDSAGAKPDVGEHWTRRDGHAWVRNQKTNGEVFKEGLLPGKPKSRPFLVGGAQLSFEQLQTLPTEPKALEQWLVDSVKHSDIKTGGGRLSDSSADEQKLSVLESLLSLVDMMPAPPKVRAAAFRAIATTPNVKDLGRVKDGRALQFSTIYGDHVRLVIDPATSQVRETNLLVPQMGAELWFPGTGGVTITAEWTNNLPG